MSRSVIAWMRFAVVFTSTLLMCVSLYMTHRPICLQQLSASSKTRGISIVFTSPAGRTCLQRCLRLSLTPVY